MGLECREKRRLGSFVAECFLHKVESLVFHSNVEARPMKGYLAEKQKSSSLSKQDIFKNKSVAKACCFYRYTSCLRQPMKSGI